MFWLRVERQSSVPLIRQLYQRVREAIMAGRLPAGSRMPSSRELSRQLRISRNVVLEAYDLLLAEGFLETRRGAGTYVAQGAVYRKEEPVPPPEVEQVSMGYDSPRGVINFRAGTPDLSRFPSNAWLRHIRAALAAPPANIFAYGHPEGRKELRRAVCDYVARQREVDCHPDQIVITAGTTQAIGIVCSLLLEGERKEVVIEEPITRDIREIAQNHGATLTPVEVDDDGMRTDLLPAMVKPAFVYVTPSHQFPIGGTLPIQRRIALLEYAAAKGCPVVEDDYDSEFRFDGPPLSSLYGLAPGRVIYIGTFSKTLSPAIRIGYLILPPELISQARSRKWLSDLHNEVTSQLALARFIESGDYLRHLGKMRKVYLRRRNTLVRALQHHFGGDVAVLGSATGLHLTARFARIRFTPEMLADLERRGARFYGVWLHSLEPSSHRDTLLIGYGNLAENEIEKGISLLAGYLKEKQAADRAGEYTTTTFA